MAKFLLFNINIIHMVSAIVYPLVRITDAFHSILHWPVPAPVLNIFMLSFCISYFCTHHCQSLSVHFLFVKLAQAVGSWRHHQLNSLHQAIHPLYQFFSNKKQKKYFWHISYERHTPLEIVKWHNLLYWFHILGDSGQQYCHTTKTSVSPFISVSPNVWLKHLPWITKTMNYEAVLLALSAIQ